MSEERTISIICLSGLESELCSQRLDATLDETERLIEFIRALWGDNNEPEPLLLVSASLRGTARLLSELESLGYNPYLVEFTGVPEVMLSGLSLDDVIRFHVGHTSITLGERLGAKKVYPAITRRELFRSMFLVTPRYVVLPEIRRGHGCSHACPYNALSDEGVDEKRCRGCMLCMSMCPSVFRKMPAWTGPASMAYVYSFAASKSLDGVLFICRKNLDVLDERAVEASPARLLAVHVPCVSWLSPRLLGVLRKLGLYVHVYYDPDACGSCRVAEAARMASQELVKHGVTVSASLMEASPYAFTGYGRRRLSEEEIAEEFIRAISS